MTRGDMTTLASAEELTCRVCATFPCACLSAEQYDERDEDLSDMEIPARVGNRPSPDEDAYFLAWLNRLEQKAS